MLPAGHDKETEQKAYDIFMEYYSAHKCDRTKPYPGIPELIRKLRAAGIKCAANSNKAHEFTQELIKLSFGDEFDDVIGFGAGFPAKPDPGAAHELIRRAGVQPSEALYVGDSNVDIQTGHNAGIDVCGALWGFRGYEELSAMNPTYLAKDAAELEKIIMG